MNKIGMMSNDLVTLEVILEPLIVARGIARNVIFLSDKCPNANMLPLLCSSWLLSLLL